MQGFDEGPDSSSPAGKPAEGAEALSAWIRELLADAQDRQLRRVEALRQEMEAEMGSWQDIRLAQALQALYAAGRQLHFSSLRAGFWQRLLGRHRAAFTHFAATMQRMQAAAAALKAEAASLEAPLVAHERNGRRLLGALEQQCQSLGRLVDKGVEWLQPMCEDINRRRAAGSDDHGLATLAEAAQSYTQEFKHLEQVASMAQEAGLRVRTILDRRAALMAQVRADLGAFDARWEPQVGELLPSVRDMARRLPGLSKAVEAHADAMKRLEAALDACGALQGEDHFLRKQLEALRAAIAERR